VEESGQIASGSQVKPPLGRYPARLDDKGRLKLPAVFQEYLSSFPERKVFVTSLDGRIGKLYPISAWRANEKEVFEGYTEDPEALQDLLFNAQDLGSEAEMDAQGRITVNPELRKELDLQGQELHLFAYKNHVEILTEALYQERKLRARPKAADNVRKLEMAGMK
jgi:MraZ protein